MKAQFEFKIVDLWVGAFLKRSDNILHIWVCFIPCIPLHVQIMSRSIKGNE
ncbi:hypothetical protein KDI_09130 [Dictyobacter arantiisoli]|uniref:Uncharacterized protein n=1 Tax=Dictyobacter arantiisoli TaxID=2014874 RepID=A0A5A5T8P6_9CHLR|nr:hypothetical protein KDI_09130 [Dictyobacter arantiisoli]